MWGILLCLQCVYSGLSDQIFTIMTTTIPTVEPTRTLVAYSTDTERKEKQISHFREVFLKSQILLSKHFVFNDVCVPPFVSFL